MPKQYKTDEKYDKLRSILHEFDGFLINEWRDPCARPYSGYMSRIELWRLRGGKTLMVQLLRHRADDPTSIYLYLPETKRTTWEETRQTIAELAAPTAV